jgi:hypothetical protein
MSNTMGFLPSAPLLMLSTAAFAQTMPTIPTQPTQPQIRTQPTPPNELQSDDDRIKIIETRRFIERSHEKAARRIGRERQQSKLRRRNAHSVGKFYGLR